MINDTVGTEHIFLLGTGSDIVDDERFTVGIAMIGADTDVVEMGAGEFPDDDITRQKYSPHPVAACGEIGLQVFDPTVVDIGVEAVGVVEPIVETGVVFFVLIDPLLHVDPYTPQCPHDHIGADSSGNGNIPAGVFEQHIRRIVGKRFAHLAVC